MTRVAPLVRGQVMASAQGNNAGAEILGISAENLATLPGIAQAERSVGDIGRFDQGLAIGSGVARALGVSVGDRVKLISPEGVKTAFGTSPRVNAYDVVYVFHGGPL